MAHRAAAFGIRGDVNNPVRSGFLDELATAPLMSLPCPRGLRKIGAGVLIFTSNLDEGVEERKNPSLPRRSSERNFCRSRAFSCSKRSMVICFSKQTKQKLSAINPSGE